MLTKRDYLLSNFVMGLAESLNYTVFQEYTCERAKIFYQTLVLPLWEKYSQDQTQQFPFESFLQGYLQTDSLRIEGSHQRAKELWQIIESVFSELDEILPFEALRNDQERHNYLLYATPQVIFGVTPDYLLKNLDKNHLYDTVIIEGDDDTKLLLTLFS